MKKMSNKKKATWIINSVMTLSAIALVAIVHYIKAKYNLPTLVLYACSMPVIIGGFILFSKWLENSKWKDTIEEMEKELDGLRKQFENIFDFLEKGIYTPEVFTARNKSLSEKITETTAAIQEAQTELSDLKAAQQNQATMLPKIRNILDTYKTLSPAEQNRLLKEVLDHVEYHKENNGRKHGLWQTPPDDFRITLFPKVSKKF